MFKLLVILFIIKLYARIDIVNKNVNNQTERLLRVPSRFNPLDTGGKDHQVGGALLCLLYRIRKNFTCGDKFEIDMNDVIDDVISNVREKNESALSSERAGEHQERKTIKTT